MATRSEILTFIADARLANRCKIVKDETQDRWIGQLTEIPSGAFPVILDKLKVRKKVPKDFVRFCLWIYRDLTPIELTDEIILNPAIMNPVPLSFIDRIRSGVARLLVGMGV